MVTLIENKVVASYVGLSTDEKPVRISDSVGLPNGSRFIEMDTGKKYFYDGNSKQWLQKPGSGGSGGASDWSFATVVVSCNGLSDATQHLLIPAIYENDSMSVVVTAERYYGEVELKVPLYKGLAGGSISNLLGASVSVSGEVTTENSGNGVLFFVRGDGTITVTGG